jgi:hypothetical protein
MTEQELNDKLAKAYGVLSHMVESPVNGDKSEWLIKDTARIMELAFDHGVHYELRKNEVMGVDSLTDKVVVEMYADHPTKKDAILWAVGLALLKKAEESKT